MNGHWIKKSYNQMDKSEPIDGENQDVKRRRSQSKFNKDLPRYQCFCSKQYLSYPALYLHLKNKHHTYFQNSKNGKRMEPTKLIEMFDPAEGFKVYKIAIDTNFMLENDRKDFLRKGEAPNLSQMRYPTNSNPFLFQNIYQQGFPYEYMPNNNRMQMMQQRRHAQKDIVIEQAIHMYMESINGKSSKERKERELLFILLIDCLNRNYALLKDEQVEDREVKRYTAEYNCDYLPRIFTHFEKIYLPAMSKESGMPYSFFLTHSHIIVSGQYKQVLQDLVNFLTGSQQRSKQITHYDSQADEEDSGESGDNSDKSENEQGDDEDNNEESNQY